ncbi:NAD-dependent epimerase/dehydratase family protein [Candidatus Planktophila dulcis]|uniref:NAD-dependent epimerase/dehydratase family protein n=1 Tax=Candidatus Planktophila dulcis TaxID=1884914 RepID=UPI003BEEFC98
MPYSKFSNIINEISFSNVIVSIRLEFLGSGSHDYLLRNDDFWEYMHRCRVMVLSSVSVYGDGQNIHYEEEAPYPLDAYAVSKVFLEGLFQSRVSSENLLILRVANLYGATGISVFFDRLCDSITTGQPLSIPTSKCLRDFVHIRDLFEFCNFWLKSELICENQILNFGTGLSWNLNEVVQLAANLDGSSFEINYEEAPPVIPISRISVDKLNLIWDYSRAELNSAMIRKLLPV